MSIYRYDLTFSAPDGCPMAVLSDMARHDKATVISVGSDLRCQGNNVRRAVLLGRVEPTMERWATFGLGTVIEKIAVQATDPFAMQNPSDAIEPRGPRP